MQRDSKMLVNHLVRRNGARILALFDYKLYRFCAGIRIDRGALKSGFNVAGIVKEVNVDKVVS